MDHCKFKNRHIWVDAYGIGKICSVCGRQKIFKTTLTGRKNAKGVFGRVKNQPVKILTKKGKSNEPRKTTSKRGRTKQTSI